MRAPPISGKARALRSAATRARAMTVTTIATPPKSGTGRVCQRSWRGGATKPLLVATARQTGTSAAESARAMTYQETTLTGLTGRIERGVEPFARTTSHNVRVIGAHGNDRSDERHGDTHERYGVATFD